jgi:glycosyltransferase involved in cell wall biosynthesis
MAIARRNMPDTAMIGNLNVANSITVVIPVYNGAATLRDCLHSVFQTADSSCECIVVDDGSTDDSAEIARRAGARVIQTPVRQGPAHARNLGARAASGDILLFIDADVRVHQNTLARAVAALAEDGSIDALIGSYDFEPGAPNFLSQYKNLFHSFVHHHGRRDASTFWTGCGAIRRSVFLATGGFPEHWTRPSVEDIEFGAAIRRLGGRIRLDPDLEVKHLKRWDLAGLLRTDIFDRAIPWTRLMLRSGAMPNDLNLRIDQRFCVALVCLAPILAARFPILSFLSVLLTMALNLPLYRFFAARHGWWFAVRVVPLHLLYFLYSGLAMMAGAALYAVEANPSTVQLEIAMGMEPAPGPDLEERPVDVC